jgi:hypothetical protein
MELQNVTLRRWSPNSSGASRHHRGKELRSFLACRSEASAVSTGAKYPSATTAALFDVVRVFDDNPGGSATSAVSLSSHAAVVSGAGIGPSQRASRRERQTFIRERQSPNSRRRLIACRRPMPSATESAPQPRPATKCGRSRSGWRSWIERNRRIAIRSRRCRVS